MTKYETYVKAHPETGEEMERTAYSPREVVALEFDGWRKKETKSKSAGSSSSSSKSSSS